MKPVSLSVLYKFSVGHASCFYKGSWQWLYPSMLYTALCLRRMWFPSSSCGWQTIVIFVAFVFRDLWQTSSNWGLFEYDAHAISEVHITYLSVMGRFLPHILACEGPETLHPPPDLRFSQRVCCRPYRRDMALCRWVSKSPMLCHHLLDQAVGSFSWAPSVAVMYSLYLRCRVGHAGRSRVRSPMLTLEFFIDIILPAALRLTQTLREMSTRRPVRRADNLTTFMCRLSWNLVASTCWNPQGLSRPVMELLYPYLFEVYLVSIKCSEVFDFQTVEEPRFKTAFFGRIIKECNLLSLNV